MIYLSYNYMVEEIPSWLNVFTEYCKDNKIAYYVSNDLNSFQKLELQPVSELVTSKIKLLNMDLNLLEDLSNPVIKERLKAYLQYGLNETTTAPLFFNLYMLLRSDVIVMNLNARTEPHDLIVSKFLGIPSLCITDSYSLNPYTVEYSSAITKPTSTKDIHNLIKGLLNGK